MLRSVRLVAVCFSLALALGVIGCKKDRVKEFSKVRTACRAGNVEKAKSIIADMTEDDRMFKALVDEAAADVGESRINYCNQIFLQQVERRLNDPEWRAPVQ